MIRMRSRGPRVALAIGAVALVVAALAFGGTAPPLRAVRRLSPQRAMCTISVSAKIGPTAMPRRR